MNQRDEAEGYYRYSQSSLNKGWFFAAFVSGFPVIVWHMRPGSSGFFILLAMVGTFLAFFCRSLINEKSWYVRLLEDGVEIYRGGTPVFVKWDSVKVFRDSYAGGGGLATQRAFELLDGTAIAIDPGIEKFQELVNEIRERVARNPAA